jgi:hypothetical protein
MSRIILTVKEIHSFAGKGMSEEALETRLSEDNDYRHSLAKKYAMKDTLHNGATLEFPADGYRNNNLLFWDAQNKEIVEPFSEIDDYGSVPPRFVVGDGYFDPFDWSEEVEHNSYVFPSKPLINEMKAFALENPDKNKMIVHMNGCDYIIYYNPLEMKGQWDTCILSGEYDKYRRSLKVYPGDPEWRKTIVDVIEEPKELSELEKLKASNSLLTKTVEELTAKLIDVTSNVEQLTARLNSV